MPEIARFFGITITMYYRDHEPAHLHAKYGECRLVVDIESGAFRGDFPPRVLAFVLEWWGRHRLDLEEDWERARAGQDLRRIAPLE